VDAHRAIQKIYRRTNQDGRYAPTPAAWPFLIFSWERSRCCGLHIFPVCTGSRNKSFLMAAVNFPHQDSFGLAEGLNLAVAFAAGRNRSANQADQNQSHYEMSEFLHHIILNL
jgi:hypothetical protein